MFQQTEKEFRVPLYRETSYTLATMPAGERARLVRYCAYLTGSVDAAEDLTQETLFEAWRNQHKLYDQGDRQNKETWDKWLRAIAHNVCMRWARGRGRELARLAPLQQHDDETVTDIEELAASDYDLEIELERDELAQLLDRALALLPPITRDVLIERFIHESSHAEIAGRLGLSEDALVQRLHRGKLALRRVISKHMSEEAAAYGLTVPASEKLEQETRIWCPLCSKRRLIKYVDPESERIDFTCSMCWNIASALHPNICSGVNSPRSILARQLTWLHEYYFQAINEGCVPCPACKQPTQTKICHPQDIPQEYYQLGGRSYHGIHILCPNCHREEINPLSHLALDTIAARQFWRKHPRMLWLPEHEIEYSGQLALLSSFQSLTDSTQLDVIFQRETLKLLNTHEFTR